MSGIFWRRALSGTVSLTLAAAFLASFGLAHSLAAQAVKSVAPAQSLATETKTAPEQQIMPRDTPVGLVAWSIS